MKLNKYVILTITLSISMAINAMAPQSITVTNETEATERLNRLQEKFAQQHNFFPLSPLIQPEVDNALRICGITEPIIALQDVYSTNSAVYPLVDELYYPVKALVLGVEDDRGDMPLPLIRHSIFHECGHIVAGDVDQNVKKNAPILLGLATVGACAGVKTIQALKDFSPIVRGIVGIGSGIGSLFVAGQLYQKTIGVYQTRKIERNADIYAAQKLIELEDYYALALCFLDFTFSVDEGNHNWKNEPAVLHDHPSYLERARIILDTLRMANVDLNNLPINEHINPDKQDIQQKFNTQVNKYFPEFLKV